MALILQPLCSCFTTNKPHPLLLHTSSHPKISIKAQQQDSEVPASASKSENQPSGLGFGSSAKKKQSKRKGERASIIRREPVEKPNFAAPKDAEEVSKNESAFVLAWLGLGAVIILQGIALAASGLLPEELDSFFVKYLYPSFTPTVFLFVAGTTGYGVLKYLQNENSNTSN